MKFKSIYTLIFFMLCLSLNITKAQIQNTEYDNDGNISEINLNFDEPRFKNIQIQDSYFDSITIKGLKNTTEIGLPQLPVYILHIEIPIGYEIENVNTISNLVGSISTNRSPYPHQKALLRNQVKNDDFDFDSNFYKGSEIFPKSIIEYNTTQFIGKSQIIEIKCFPLAYLPDEDRYYFYPELSIEIFYKKTNSKANVSIDNHSLLEKFYIPQQHSDFRSTDQNPDEMLIIVADKFYQEIIPFAEWKNRKGIKTSIIKTSEIGSVPDENDIKAFVSEFYNNPDHNLKYLLLVGDVNYIPPFYGINQALNDHNYACVSGEDILPDIEVGRFSVNTIEECKTYVNKTLKYEKHPSIDMTNGWFNKASIIASSANLDNSHGKHLTSFMKKNEFSKVDDLRAAIQTFNQVDILKAINEGRSWVFYIGHGDKSAWLTQGTFSTKTIETNLENYTYLPSIISVACANSDLDYSTFSFGERWMNIGRDLGAITFIGATENTPFFYSDTLGKQTLMSYIEGNTETIGEALIYGKYKMLEAFPENKAHSSEECMQHFLLLGDPSLKPWIKIPTYLFVDYADQVKRGSNDILVNVSSSTSIIANATVCLSNSDFSYFEVEVTDSLGQASFYGPFNDTGYLHLVVSGRDLKTFYDSIRVTSFVGIQETTPNFNIDFYPNPATDKLYWNIPRTNKIIEKIEILSIEGKSIQIINNPTNHEIDLNLNPGLYLIKFYDQGQNFTVKKFVVE